MAVFAWAVVLSTGGCAHLVSKDLLPEAGRYRLQMLKPDGSPEISAQEFLVLRDHDAAAILYLRGVGGIPVLCLGRSEARVCEDVLAGHHLANAYVSGPRGLARLEAEVVLAEPLRVGTSWKAVEVGDCRLVREVVAVGADKVVVEVTSRCSGRAAERKFSETWVRGIGLQELTTADGHRTLITREPEM